MPSNLYLASAQLKTFDGMGNFHKVSQTLKRTGMTDEFLLQLGVRQSVAVDFLFANLDQLKWSSDPKPLIEYLRSATLTKNDMEKLKGTQYLPSENDTAKMFAPSELFLPDSDLRLFPFVRILQWPSDDDVTERSLSGKFLTSLGMNVSPPLRQVLKYAASDEVTENEIRLRCLDFVAKRLGSGGSYHGQYSRLNRSERSSLKILPCVLKSPLSGEEKRGCYSVLSCCSDPRVAVMGFPVLDLGTKTKLYGNLFQVADEPDVAALVQQLTLLVSMSKKTYVAANNEQKRAFCPKILSSFSAIFQYLSTREFSQHALRNLEDEAFIPCLVDSTLQWFIPSMVFFKNANSSEERSDLDIITESLFPSVPFSPFLSSAGVKQEATTKDIFSLMLRSPKDVYNAVKSEKRYRTLLRRIAAHRPFRRVTSEIREAPFLLAYTVSEGEDGKEKTSCELTRASDIFIIDNTFFGRMFEVKRAPHESDLEEFYSLIGSQYISEVVHKKFDIVGKPHESRTTAALMERIEERGPLLVSPSVTSRQLVDDAASILLPENFIVLQASEVNAVYKLKNSLRSNKTTCCSQQGRFGKKNSIVITPDFEVFDVGMALGELVLQRCQLEDAFFISSLLEAPLDQLRARGFPVDRIIKAPQHVQEDEPEPESPTLATKGGGNGAPHSSVTAQESNDRKSATSAGSQKASQPPASLDSRGKEQPDPQSSKDAHISILKQMFPGADEAYIADLLGSDPNLDKVKQVAEDLAVNGYPETTSAHDDTSTVATSSHEEVEEGQSKSPSKLLGSKKLGRALNGLKGSNFGGLPNRLKHAGMKSFGNEGGMSAPPSGDSNRPILPKDDAMLQENMEKSLQEKVMSSPSVEERGLKSSEQTISIPEGLDHGSTCEVLPSQDIKPFVTPNGKSTAHNGIKIFSYSKSSSSE
ncbi:MAG: hypothetical protein SGILL_004129, partial [Bacillariaceae sp.]